MCGSGSVNPSGDSGDSQCYTMDLEPDAGICSGKVVSMRQCAPSQEAFVLMQGFATVSYNAMTVESWGGCSESGIAQRDERCAMITAGATGTDVCGGMACFGFAMCTTGLDPFSFFTLVTGPSRSLSL